jgi:hypothetical protein
MDNIFSGLDLLLPTGDAGVNDSLLRQWVDRKGADGFYRAPLERQVDLWWIALCLGVQDGQRSPMPAPERRTKFAEGGILNSDPWRITHLSLLGIGELGEDATSRPAEIVRLANEYVVTGVRILREMLEGAAEPALTLWTRLEIPEDQSSPEDTIRG